MNSDDYIQTRLGRQLFELLPEVYRTRDTIGPNARGDLARYLDAGGYLLDLIRHTLDQRLADIFPDAPVDGPAGQSWLLPYIADLLDVHMVSPDDAGRRGEVANAVAWRQRKGTVKVLEQIAEQVGRLEVELQEGWKRVATTPLIGRPLLPAPALGESESFDAYTPHPNWAARHPGLNATTVDLRYPSRALQLPSSTRPPQNPAAKQTRFAGIPVWWRQVNPHGAPRFPGSYEDVSRRTVDLRTPNWRQGQIHPKRAVLYAPPPAGFFPYPQPSVTFTPNTDMTDFDYAPCTHTPAAYCAEFPLAQPPSRVGAGTPGVLEVATDAEADVWLPVTVTAVSGQVLTLMGPVPPESVTFPVPVARVKLRMQNSVTIYWDRRGEVKYQSLFEEHLEEGPGMSTPVRVFRNRTLGTDWFMPIKILKRIDLAEAQTFRFEGLHLDNTLTIDQGHLELVAVAARRVEIATGNTGRPVLDAKDSLIKNLTAPAGLVRLVYCTLLEPAVVMALEASDSIFLGILKQRGGPPPAPACLRYSRLPAEQRIGKMFIHENTRDPVVMWTTEFGISGCGVLHPATADSVRFGAEDGGEMGAYHQQKHSLLLDAVLDKLKGFLPVGIEAVIVPDPRLLTLPIESCESGNNPNEPE